MKKFLFYFISIIFSFFLFSQETIKSIEEDYYDFLSLQGLVERPTLGYRTLSDSKWIIPENVEHLWKENNLGSFFTFIDNNSETDNWFLKGIDKSFSCKIINPVWFNSYNLNLPYGQNDGALWQGRGYNTSLSFGIYSQFYGFEFSFAPMICFSQNLSFDYLPGVYGDSHSYFWRGSIDLVQRYGDNPFWTFDWGDSEIRYNFHTFTIGFGTQAPWIGPSWLNPMLGGNNSPTYPKLDFGIRKTALSIPSMNIDLGNIEGRFIAGKLTESEYFNNDTSDNENVFFAFNASYSPSFIDGITIGATKICITKWSNRKIQYLNPFYDNNDWTGVGEDQKASIYIDWLLASVGLEQYFEFGIDDYCEDKIANPFHTAIFTFGLKKELPFFKDLQSELILEFNNNEMSQDFHFQWNYMGYYAHGGILQGFTQKGQIIGNGYAFAGNSQFLGYKVYYPKGNTFLYIHRFVPDINYILNIPINTVASKSLELQYYNNHRTFLTFGVESTYIFNKSYILSAGLNVSYAHNYMYKDDSDLFTARFYFTGKVIF